MTTVSIILPTYNRAKFLPEAFEAIRTQDWTDWELIVVDDGSTDNTRDLVPELTRGWPQPVRYVYQENQGPAAARNRGIEESKSSYLAFFDSDDLWLPHHLEQCVEALEANRDVDWVYSASRVINETTGELIAENVFHANGGRLSFLSLDVERRGTLSVIVDADTGLMALSDALYAGLQGSVIRQSVFSNLKLPNFRVGEDQTFSFVALKEGFRLAYFDQVHFVYRTHADGISAGPGVRPLNRARASMELARAFESLLARDDLSGTERRVLTKRVCNEYFWNAGYPLQNAGMFKDARMCFRKGLRMAPLRLGMWKSYAVSYLKEIQWALRGCRALQS